MHPGHEDESRSHVPSVGDSDVGVDEIAVAYEHDDFGPREIIQVYPDLSLSDVHRALAYYYENIDEFPAPAETVDSTR